MSEDFESVLKKHLWESINHPRNKKALNELKRFLNKGGDFTVNPTLMTPWITGSLGGVND